MDPAAGSKQAGFGKVEAAATAVSGPGPVLDARRCRLRCGGLAGAAQRAGGSVNEVKAVGNGAMTLYTINPNVKTLADFGDENRIGPHLRHHGVAGQAHG